MFFFELLFSLIAFPFPICFAALIYVSIVLDDEIELNRRKLRSGQELHFSKD
jgi:predicted transporter